MAKLSALVIVIASISIRLCLANDERCDGEQEKCDAPRRTRREVQQNEKLCTDGSKTPFQAQRILNSHVGKFQQDSFNEENMRNKSNFVKAAQELIPAMCKNITVGGSQWIASSNLSTWIHVQRKPCNDTAGSLSDVPCQNCSKVGRYKVMQQVPPVQWNCTQNSRNTTACEGVCIGSVRMREDMISNYSSKCLSHIIDVQMFNPTTSRPINFDTSQTVMALQIEFDKGDRQYSSSNFECALWRGDIKRWNSSLCTLEVVSWELGQNRTLANCNCTTLGSVCITPSRSNVSVLWPTPWNQSDRYNGTTASIQSGTTASSKPRTTVLKQTATTAHIQSETTASTRSMTTASIQPVTTPSSQSTLSTNEVSGNNGLSIYISITFRVDCNAILDTPKRKELITLSKEKMKTRLAIQENQIANITLRCGSIIILFTLKGLNSSTLDQKTKLFNSMILSNSFVITFADGTKLVASKSGIGTEAENLTYINPSPTTVRPTTRERFKLEFDYRPIMFTVAFVILAVILCVCGSCIVHSYWLKRDKFTKYNSMTAKEYQRKMKAKEEKDRMKEVEEVQMTAIGTSRKVLPTNFDMSNETLPKINERNFTNYHWAQTSFIPPAVEAPVPDSPDAPKLMLDDSDSDTDGEENKGYESDDASTQIVSRAVSHLSLAKDKSIQEGTSDSMSNIVPPLYENIDKDEHLYDSIKEN